MEPSPATGGENSEPIAGMNPPEQSAQTALGDRLHKPGVAGSSPAAATLSPDETIVQYHSDAEWLSKSQLWDFISHGPAYFHARHIARTLQPYGPEGSFAKGTLVHQWAEDGPDAWWSRVVEIPPDVLGQGGRRIGLTNTWCDQQLASRPDAILLKADEIEQYKAQFDAILANPVFQRLCGETIAREISIRWIDPVTGVWCKCRPDALTEEVVWDIKTTKEQNPLRDFWKSVVSYGYDIQAVHYLAGCEAARLKADKFIFLVTSTVPPYACHAVTLPQGMLTKARRTLLSAMADLNSRLTFDHWLPDDSGQVTELYVPGRFMEDRHG